jgi:RimJ/RimL family protein N-acetyltransferase
VFDFSPRVTDFWQASRQSGEILAADASLVLVSDPTVAADRRVSIVRPQHGAVTITISPEIADGLGLGAQDDLRDVTVESVLAALGSAGIALHDADNLFYLPESAKSVVSRDANRQGIRRLDSRDAAQFAEFEASATDEDRDDAYVELDHWAVFGAFDDGRLVAAASAYPWGDGSLADEGVLTLAAYRGRGFARGVVSALSRHALAEGLEPQYRCQLDNVASAAVARSAGFALFGTWQVVSPDSTG